MGINSVNIKYGLLHEHINLKFSKGRIASIVGLNGNGKTFILNSINNEQQQSLLFNQLKEINIEYELTKNDISALNTLVQSLDLKFIKLDEMHDSDYEQYYRKIIKKSYDQVFHAIKKAYTTLGAELPIKVVPESFEEMLSLCREVSILENHYDKIYEWSSQISNLMNQFRSKVKIKYITENNNISHDFYVFFNEIGKIAPQKTLMNNGKLIISLVKHLGLKFPKQGGLLSSFDKKISRELSKQVGENNIYIKTVSTWEDNAIRTQLTFYDLNGSVLEWDNLSEGTRRYMNVILQLGSVDEYTLILIDEPEKGLHPAMQKELRYMLQQIVEDTGCRIVITTHSQYMLNSFSNYVNTYVAHKEGNNFILSNITDYQHKNGDLEGVQIWNALGISEIESFKGLNKDSKIILVEGTSDAIYIKKFLSMNKVELDKWRILPAGGNGMLKYRSNYLCEYMSIPQKNILIIADGDVIKNKETKKITEKEYGRFGMAIILDHKTIEDIFDENTKKQIKYNDRHKNIAAMNFARGKHQLSKTEKESINKLCQKIIKIIKN